MNTAIYLILVILNFTFLNSAFSQNLCSQLFKEQALKSASQKLIKINHFELEKYNDLQLKKILNKSVQIKLGYGLELPRTKIYSLDQYDKETQKLILKLRELSKNRKYLRQYYIFEKNRILNELLSSEYINTILSLKYGKNLSDKQKVDYIINDPFFSVYIDHLKIHENKDFSFVEVGAVIIHTKNGQKFTAIHTSSHGDKIDSEDVSASMNSLSIRNNIDTNDLVKIEYFHTHPDRNSISANDVAYALAMQYEINQTYNINITFHVNAITKYDNTIVINSFNEPVINKTLKKFLIKVYESR